MDDFRPGGVLFTNTRKTAPNQPDFTGSITIDADQLKLLNAQAREQKPITFELSGWRKTSSKARAWSTRPGSCRPSRRWRRRAR